MISNFIEKKYLIIIGLIIITLALIHLYSTQIDIITNINKLSKKCDDVSKKIELNNTEIYLLKQVNNAKPTDTLYEMSYNSKEETPIQCIEINKTKDNIQESVNVDVSQLINKITDKKTEDDILDSVIIDKKQKYNDVIKKDLIKTKNNLEKCNNNECKIKPEKNKKK